MTMEDTTNNHILERKRPKVRLDIFFFLPLLLKQQQRTPFLRKRAAANMGLPNVEVDRRWDDSNPRLPSLNASTLSAWPPPVFSRLDYTNWTHSKPNRTSGFLVDGIKYLERVRCTIKIWISSTVSLLVSAYEVVSRTISPVVISV